jgi:hypothetical protein
MPDTSPEAMSWRVERLERQLETETARLAREVTELEKEVRSLRDRAEARERSLFMAGIAFLGSLILGLIGVLWANLGAIFPGRGP